MVSLDVLAFVYREGIYRLGEGFAAAIAGLRDQRDQLIAELAAYEAHIEAGGEVEGEWDEENGGWLYRKDDFLRLQVESAETAPNDLRSAYVIMIYHHWERSMQRRLGKRMGHDDLVKRLRKAGRQIDGRLVGLRALVNLLKHDKYDQGILSCGWPFLPAGMTVPAHSWHEVAYLTDQHVIDALDIVRQSGPPPVS